MTGGEESEAAGRAGFGLARVILERVLTTNYRNKGQMLLALSTLKFGINTNNNYY